MPFFQSPNAPKAFLAIPDKKLRSEQTIASSKSTIETVEKGVKYFRS